MNSRYKIRSCQEEEFPGQVAKADCFMTNLTKTDKFDWLPIGRPFVIGVMNPPTFTEEYANLKKKLYLPAKQLQTNRAWCRM